MRQRSVHVALLILITSMALPAQTSADEGLEAQLYRRFQPSRIEIQDPSRRGMIVRQGRLLTLARDAVPAKVFRVMRANPTSPTSHVMEFARVEVRPDGSVLTEPGPLVIPGGSRIVVLEVKVRGDLVHLLTHTAGPVATTPSGGPEYGCTEFVFHVPSRVLKGSDAEPLFQLIESWLAWSPDLRMCAPGDPQLCLEP